MYSQNESLVLDLKEHRGTPVSKMSQNWFWQHCDLKRNFFKVNWVFYVFLPSLAETVLMKGHNFEFSSILLSSGALL